MSLNTLMSTATTGLAGAQLGLKTVSDNIANLNTPGYVRKVVDANSLVLADVGVGVSSSGISRAANQFLQNASLSAAADASQSSAVSNILDQAQTLFGDPSSPTSYFNQLNTVFTDFAAASNDPASSLTRTQTIGDVTQFLNESKSIASSLSTLGVQADRQIGNDVTQANQILGQIAALNKDITRETSMSADASDAQNAQSQLINQLATLMDVKVQANTTGGVVLTSQSGATLVGQAGAATLGYLPSNSAASAVTVTQPGGAQQPATLDLASGEMQGLLNTRNAVLPGLQSQLSEFVTQAANAINQAHNASSAVPPPAQLAGQNTGLDLPTAISGFTGKTTVAVVDSSGQLQKRVDIDFTAGTMSVNGGAATAFTPANFITSLNTALGASGTASFSNGALTLNASVAGTGLAIQDDATTPSARVGEGFSQFFGLNNLISSTGLTNFNTGLKPTDANGFTPGQTLTLRLTDAKGAPITDVTVAVPAGGTVQNLVDAMNAPAGGVGLYGQFSLDSQGALTFAPNTPGGVSLSVVSDNTTRGVGGPSVSQLFGIGDQQRANRTFNYSVRSDISANPGKLALAQLNLGLAVGQPVLAIGDNSGALALAKAGGATMNFAAAGDMAAIATSVTQYAGDFAGVLGNKAAAAQQATSNAQAVQTDAEGRRQSTEGVNLDQELVNLTTYQQAYSASARVITATQDMFTTLLGMMR